MAFRAGIGCRRELGVYWEIIVYALSLMRFDFGY